VEPGSSIEQTICAAIVDIAAASSLSVSDITSLLRAAGVYSVGEKSTIRSTIRIEEDFGGLSNWDACGHRYLPVSHRTGC
jgi:hypothetical protein